MSNGQTGSQPSPEALINSLRSQLFSTRATESGFRTYAILDGASVPDLLDHLYASPRPEFACLYRGELEPDLAEVAPYLIRLEPDAAFTEWLLAKGWGNHWGVFAHSRADLSAMRKHLRGFLMVQDPQGKQLYLRYYDPRVLRAFFPIGDAVQLLRMFGPTDCYLCEGASPSEILRHRLDREKFIVERIELGKTRNDSDPDSAAVTVRNLEAVPSRDGREILMSIRREQMDTLAAPRSAQLLRKIVRYLRERCPKEVRLMSDEILQTQVKNSIGRASLHGIVIEWDLCRYCWLEVLHGPAFAEEVGWARTILESNDVTPTERVDMLEHYQRNYHEPMFNPR